MKAAILESHRETFPFLEKKLQHLGFSEISKPQMVIEEFFDQYTLEGIRRLLEALLTKQIPSREQLKAYRGVIRLVEAAWFINEGGRFKKQEKAFSVAPARTSEKVLNKKLTKEIKALLKPVSSFFDSYHSAEASNLVRSISWAAESREIWKEGNPADLLHFSNSLKSLLKAIYSIVENKRIQSTACGELINDLSLLGECKSHFNQETSVMDTCPTHCLTKQEASVPLVTLLNICRRHKKYELLGTIQLLQEYALTSSSVTDSGNSVNVFQTTEACIKLLEASHLILVRLPLKV